MAIRTGPALLVAGAALLLCQIFPLVDVERPHGVIAAIKYTLQEQGKRAIRAASLDRVPQRLPSWLGLWHINVPKGRFHPSFPTAEEIQKEAEQLVPLIEDVIETKFFRIFKVDLSRQCPFWVRRDLCTSPTESCGVCECTEDQVPIGWKEKPIEHFVDRRFFEEEVVTPWDNDASSGGLEGLAGIEERNFLEGVSGEDGKGTEATYVDLSMNPPGFTAYKGRNIWGLIYKENCLQEAEEREDDQCRLENDMFERVISGLQTAVMTLASEYNVPLHSTFPIPLSSKSRLLKNRGEYKAPRHWYNLDLFRWRVAPNRRWLENLYINFSLIVRTVQSVYGIVESCPCWTGDAKEMILEDERSRKNLRKLLAAVASAPSASTDRLAVPLFVRKQDKALEQFDNISKIFDCIECELCRLHGKVKLTALQVALKALSGENRLRKLERNELVALINGLHYFGDSILIVQKFQQRLSALRQLLLLIVGAVAAFFFTLFLAYREDKRQTKKRAD